MPAPTDQRTIEKDRVKESDDGTKREEKRTQETVTPEGTSHTTTTTKSKTETDN